MLGSDDALDFIAPASLYVHIPLCASKCAYCDFFSSASECSEEAQGELVEATLTRAAVLSARFGAGSFETVYVGGGTPTFLSKRNLDRLLGGIELLIGAPAPGLRREWTVEANPDSLRPETLDIILAHGVTRLSIGVQSLDPDELATLGRRHGPDAALRALRTSAEAGLDVSADLIAGIPVPAASRRGFDDAGKMAGFARELHGAGARHLSVYDLTVEEGTPLAKAIGGLRFPSEDEEWEARCLLESALLELGMRRYEISNYAAVDDECRHNLAYWRMDSYIGAGPGAVSTLARRSGGSLRIEEPKVIEGYGRPSGACALETDLGSRDAILETVMMAFRTSFGLDLVSFRERFGIGAEALIGDSLARWGERVVKGEAWPGRTASRGPALDGKGLDILNRFLGDCIEEMDKNAGDFSRKYLQVHGGELEFEV
jgi:oxygen-independent coproporphyrinogen III oxidase